MIVNWQKLGRKQIFVLLTLCWLAMPQLSLADPPADQSSSPAQSAGGTNLDLTSTAANVSTANLFTHHPDVSQLVINSGSQAMTVTSTTMVTPAQLVAAYQVLHGAQSILIDGSGAAIGGSFNLPAQVSQHLSGLTVPTGVTGAINFSNGAAFNLAGNLSNSGNLYAFSTNPQFIDANISANNIANNQGALLSSILPGSLGINNAVNNLNLNLIAANDIINSGTISAAGNLNMTAGGTIFNNNAALMQAMGAVNLVANSGNLVNAGMIESLTSTISVNALTPVALLVNNSGGQLSAIDSIINFRNADFADKLDLRIIGGDILSRELNLNSGSGNVYLEANNVTGVINIAAGNSIVSASTPNLNIGNVCLSGDPAFYNTAGNVNIANSLVFAGQNLAIVASGNITTSAAVTLNTSSATGSGGNITIIAGANFTAVSSAGPVAPASVLPPIANANDANITLTITGASGSGGNVNLTGGGGVTTINTRATGTSGSGGDVVIAAFANGTNNGNITLLSTANINTGGSANGTNGTVLIMAGEDAGTGIFLGNINTTGGANTTFSTKPLTLGLPTGSIQILSRGPSASVGTPIVITAGNPVSGNIMAATNYQASGISTGQLTVNGIVNAANPATITVNTGGNITTGNYTTQGGDLITTNGAVIRLSAGLNAAGNAFTRPADITIYANQVNTNGAAGGFMATTFFDGVDGGNVVINQGAGNDLLVNFGVTSPILGTPTVIALNDNNSGFFVGGFSVGGDLQVYGNLNVQADVTGTTSAGFIGDTLTFLPGTTIHTITGNIFAAALSVLHNSGQLSAEAGSSFAIPISTSMTIDGNGSFSAAPGGFVGIIEILGGTVDVTIGGNQSFYAGIGGVAVIGGIGGGGGGLFNSVTISPGATLVLSVPNSLAVITANNFVNNGTIINPAPNSLLQITANGGSGLDVSGNGMYMVTEPGTFIAMGTSSDFSNPDQAFTISGNHTFIGQTLMVANGGAGSITINPGTVLNFVGGFGQIFVQSIDTTLTMQSTSNTGSFSSLTGIFISNTSGALTLTNTQVLSAPKVQMYATGGGDQISFAGGNINVNGSAQLFTPTVVNLAGLHATGGISISPTGTFPDAADAGVRFVTSVLNNNGTVNVLPATAATPAIVISRGGLPFLIAQPSSPNFSAIGTRIATDYTPITEPSQTLFGYANIEQSPTGSNIALFMKGHFDDIAIDQLSINGVIPGNGSSNNYLVLDKGNILFSPTEDIVVQTHEGKIFIAAHSVAYVVETGNDVAVLNLYSHRPNAVQVLVGNKLVDLGPGREIVLTRKQSPVFEKVNPSPAIAYRNARLEEVENGISAFGCDFSIPSAISQITPLKAMLTSSNRDEAQVMHKVLRSSIILSQLTGTNGLYKTSF